MTSAAKLKTEHLTEDDCERILNVLQRDLHLRNRERKRLRPEDEIPVSSAKPPRAPKAQSSVYDHLYANNTDIEHFSDQYSLKSSLNKFTSQTDHNNIYSNRHSIAGANIRPLGYRHTNLDRGSYRNSAAQFCSRCGQGLSPLTKRNAQCVICMQWICKPCALWETKHDGYICEQHVDEKGYSDFNRLNSDWKYDSEAKCFTRTYKGEIAATIGRRLSNDFSIDSTSTTDGILPLSLEEFLNTMKDLQAKKDSNADATDTLTEPGGDKLKASDFFQSTEEQGSNLITTDELDSAFVRGELHNNGGRYDAIDEHSFPEVKDAETKKFLIEVDVSVQKIRKCLAKDATESETEDMLSSHRSALSSLIANMEQSLHLAVDNQSPAAAKLVRHTEVAGVVCSIVEEYIGESLTGEAINKGALDYNEVADSILVKILEDRENEEVFEGEQNSIHIPKSTSPFSMTSMHSDYGSSKFPDFTSCTSMETDPDLLSLGQDSRAAMEEDTLSEDGSRWDGESIVSDTSNNWLLRGKLVSDTLSATGGSLFNSDSSSEESLNIIAVPGASSPPHGSDDDLSDSGSDLTLTSLGHDLFENSDGSVSMSDVMRMNRTNSGSERVRRVSAGTAMTGSRNSEYSENGEDSKELSFVSRPKSLKVRQGEVAKFACSVSGTAPIDVYWFKEGEEHADALETSDKYEVCSEDDKHSLEIFFATPEDNGQYMCLAKNDSTSSHWLFGLTVDESASYDQKPPLFLKELFDIEASEGEVVKFRCKVRAYPLPRISWYKDGERIDSSHQYKLEKFGNRDYTLTISGVTPNHDAEFSVLAKNGAGEAKSSAQLLVEPAESNDRHHSRRRDSTKVHGMDEDVVTKKPADKPRKPFAVLQANSSTSPPQVSELTFAAKGSKDLTNQKSPALSEISDFIRSSLEAETIPEEEASLPPSECDQSPSLERSTQDMPVASRRSLRASMQAKGRKDSFEEEVKNTVTIKPKQNLEPRQQQTEKMLVDDGRHSSVVELVQVAPHVPLKPLETSTSNNKERSISSPTSQMESNTQQQTTPSNADRQERASRPTRLSMESAGVDIQPGFVRERQFLQFGDKLTPTKSPAKHKKGVAPSPPVKVPETIELTGSSQQEDVPSSRSEWTDFFPSVKQRKESFVAEESPSTVAGTSNDSTRKSKKKSQAPSPTAADTAEPAKKKTVKKYVKRTVQRTTCKTPVSSTDFGDQPPGDGDYIKICGKWVKMKSPVRHERHPIARGASADDSPEDIPLSRSEWGPDVSIGSKST